MKEAAYVFSVIRYLTITGGIMKQILITGANSGLGLASSKMLARDGHHIIMLCRNQQRGEIALREVQEVGSAELVLCDLSDTESITTFSESWGDRKIDVLMHNAGVVLTDRQLTKQGFEATIGINHLAVYHLTHVLWKCLTEKARVVIVSSDAHWAAKLDLSKWMAEDKYSMIQQYGSSKLCNILFSSVLAERSKNSGITVNAVHPGGVNTNLGEGNKVWYAFLGRFVKKFMISPEKGADTQVWLAISPEMEGQNGGYYYKRRLRKMSKQAQDQKLAVELWNVSASLLDLDPNWPE